ncbi:CD59 molecule, complement regulatory protein precursor, partial [Silurus asotus]
MKSIVQVSVVVLFALIGVGSALKCYSCVDYSGKCDNVETCSGQNDGCLNLKERNGRNIRQCVRFSDCQSSLLAPMFPNVASFGFSCCESDLCNGASVGAGRTSAIALLLSLALFWCI